MKFFIDNLPVCVFLDSQKPTFPHPSKIIFPYDRIYPGSRDLRRTSRAHSVPEQYAYMCDLKRTLDATVRTHTAAPRY